MLENFFEDAGFWNYTIKGPEILEIKKYRTFVYCWRKYKNGLAPNHVIV